MREELRYCRSPDFVHRRVAQEEILVPVRRSGADLSSLYLLNATAAELWTLLAEPRSESEMIASLTASFDVEAETARDDLRGFLAELVAVGALRREEAT